MYQFMTLTIFMLDVASFADVPTQDVRLAGGDGLSSGRVEVYHEGVWGTVCDDYWYRSQALIVCRALGYKYATPMWYGAFGPGIGPIWLSGLECNGSENSITECDHPGWGIHDCDHTEDAGVNCSNTDVAIQLVDGDMSHGRLEILHDGEWGTICKDQFVNRDAGVACRQLGYTTGELVPITDYGPGSGLIWLTHVRCDGTETQLAECNHAGWGNKLTCIHERDVAIKCYNEAPGVRLTEGSSPGSGLVEINVSGEWGNICSSSWGEQEAAVVCRQLGFKTGTAHSWHPQISKDAKPVWMTWVPCIRTELYLSECHTGPLTQQACDAEYGLAGVVCENDVTEEEEFDMRLVNGSDIHSGRVEVYHAGNWGTICDMGWTDLDATLVCQAMGYAAGMAMHKATYGQGHGPIWIGFSGCEATNKRFVDCGLEQWGNTLCQHSQDAGVICLESANSSLPVRLMGGAGTTSGRVEVMLDGVWGSICDDGWDTADATVICRQLGYTEGFPTHGASFGEGSGIIWQWNIECVGHEDRLDDCRLSHWGGHSNYCTHSEDAGVICTAPAEAVDMPPTLPAVRLIGLDGTEASGGGRVEVSHSGEWGSVCDDEWNDIAASVVCRELGYAEGKSVVGGRYGEGQGIIWLDNVRCSGQEMHIRDCDRNGWGEHNCHQGEAAGAVCCGREKQTDLPSNVRLSDEISPGTGFVQVHYAGEWGYICNQGFDDKAATIVCNELGYTTGTVISPPEPHISSLYTRIWMDDVHCTGCEISVAECSHKGWGYYTCDMSELAVVKCSNPTQDTNTDQDILVTDSFSGATTGLVYCRILSETSGITTYEECLELAQNYQTSVIDYFSNENYCKVMTCNNDRFDIDTGQDPVSGRCKEDDNFTVLNIVLLALLVVFSISNLILLYFCIYYKRKKKGSGPAPLVLENTGIISLQTQNSKI